MKRYHLLLLSAALIFLLFAANANAQCWGVDDTPIYPDPIPLSIEDKQALRLFPSKNPYKWKGNGKRIVWGAYLIAGILHGGREAYHAEPTVFEKRFNVAPTSFFGSEQWKRNYYNNNPEEKHKPNIGNTFRDYYHFSSTVHTTFLVGGAVTIGVSKQSLKHKVFDTAIAVLIRSIAANATYNLLR